MINGYLRRFQQLICLGCAAAALGLTCVFLFTCRHKLSIKEAVIEERFYRLLLTVQQTRDMHRFYNGADFTAPETYIAHGGGVGDFRYSNSAEGVTDAIGKGFQFIELDLLLTTDGHIVAGHTWKDLKQTCGQDNADDTPLSYAEFCTLRRKSTLFHPLEATEIAALMQQNPNIILITDKITDYAALMKDIPFADRMIVEVFSVKNYVQALKAGVQYPAYCVGAQQNCRTAEELQFPIITLNAGRLFNDADTLTRIQQWHQSGVTILLYYNNTGLGDHVPFIREHAGKSFSKLYSDIWAPADIPAMTETTYSNTTRKETP